MAQDLQYRILDNNTKEFVPVDFYTRELHYDQQPVHIKPYNPLSQILDYEYCFFMYNANYSNYRYKGYTNDALLDVIDPDYKNPITAVTGNAISQISNIGVKHQLKALEIIPISESGERVKSKVKAVGRFNLNNRTKRLYREGHLSIIAFKLKSIIDVEIRDRPDSIYTNGEQYLDSSRYGGYTNAPFMAKHAIDLQNKYVACFRLGNVNYQVYNKWVFFDENGDIILNNELFSTMYDIIELRLLRLGDGIDFLEYSFFDYNAFENPKDKVMEATEKHVIRIQNLIKGI